MLKQVQHDELRGSILERNDHLVRPHQPEVATDQFVGHVGIGPPRVEQRRAVPQRLALGLERLEGNGKVSSSGTRAGEVGQWLPIIGYDNLKNPA